MVKKTVDELFEKYDQDKNGTLQPAEMIPVINSIFSATGSNIKVNL